MKSDFLGLSKCRKWFIILFLNELKKLFSKKEKVFEKTFSFQNIAKSNGANSHDLQGYNHKVKTNALKAAFELAVNGFRKSFSVKPACLAATENRIFGK